MKHTCQFAGVALLGMGLLGAPAFAQGVAQTVGLVKVDVATVATGYRTSKMVGSEVVNEAKEVVGMIDDLIVTPGEKVPFAVLSVGGFLGLDKKLVVVPFSTLRVVDKHIILPGATKDSLMGLPTFKYAT